MKLSNRIRNSIISLTVVSATLVGAVIFVGMSMISTYYQKEDLKLRGDKGVGFLSAHFAELSGQIVVLSEMAETLFEEQGITEADIDSLSNVFLAAMKANDHYMQIRLIDGSEEGNELLRYDRKSARIRRTSDSDLQQKGNRDYVKEAYQRGADQVYFTSIELNREHGEIETPYRPTFRVAKPFTLTGEVDRALVVINIDADAFLEGLLGEDMERFDVFIADLSGNYLFTSDNSKRFGTTLGHGYNVVGDYPGASAFLQSPEERLSKATESSWLRNDNLISLRRIELIAGGPTVVYGVVASYAGLTFATNWLLIALVPVLAVLIVIGWLNSQFLASRVTKPIESLVEACKRLSKGETFRGLNTRGEGEIGELAQHFERMSSKVIAQQERLEVLNKNLEEANEDLEHFAHMASHEMREPLNRISNLAQLVQLETAKPAN